MKLGIIGAGKVGVSLGKYFKEHCFDVVGIYSRSPISAKEGAKLIETKYFENVKELVVGSDILFLTVSDQSIKEVWNTVNKFDIRGKIICHCSGALSSDIFTGIEALGAWGYSLHPILSINDKATSYKEMKHCHFTLEGSGEKLSTIQRLIEKLGNKVFILDKENKARYHCAAIFSSNFMVALAQISMEVLGKCGFSNEDKQIFLPLMTVSIKNIIETGTAGALTGPVERNDMETVVSHLSCLDEDEKKIYTLLSQKLIDIAETKHPKRNYESLKTRLKGEE